MRMSHNADRFLGRAALIVAMGVSVVIFEMGSYQRPAMMGPGNPSWAGGHGYRNPGMGGYGYQGPAGYQQPQRAPQVLPYPQQPQHRW